MHCSKATVGKWHSRFVRHAIEASVPTGLEVHLILDNYGTQKTPAIQRWLLKRPRFHIHFTSTSASGLNLVDPVSKV
jgi:hypothetical protein